MTDVNPTALAQTHSLPTSAASALIGDPSKLVALPKMAQFLSVHLKAKSLLVLTLENQLKKRLLTSFVNLKRLHLK